MPLAGGGAEVGVRGLGSDWRGLDQGKECGPTEEDRGGGKVVSRGDLPKLKVVALGSGG